MPKLPVDHERRIGARAGRMWREEDCPKGRIEEYLERAREIQVLEDHPQSGLLPHPAVQHDGEIIPEEPAEEAKMVENLWEFPGRLTDQASACSRRIGFA